jgi:hypothetical protein
VCRTGFDSSFENLDMIGAMNLEHEKPLAQGAGEQSTPNLGLALQHQAGFESLLEIPSLTVAEVWKAVDPKTETTGLIPLGFVDWARVQVEDMEVQKQLRQNLQTVMRRLSPYELVQKQAVTVAMVRGYTTDALLQLYGIGEVVGPWVATVFQLEGWQDLWPQLGDSTEEKPGCISSGTTD